MEHERPHTSQTQKQGDTKMKCETFKIFDTKNQETRPNIKMSTGQGCGLKGCHCSDGYWISTSNGKTGILFTFESKREMQRFFKTHKMTCRTKNTRKHKK